MKHKIFFSATIFILFVFIIESCSIRFPVKSSDSLSKAKRIVILTKDNSVYRLSEYELKDSVISGKGKVRKNGIDSDFKGEIKIVDINAIDGEKTSVGSAFVTTAAFLVVSGVMLGFLAAEGENKAESHTTYHSKSGSGGSGSCPTIFSKSGNNYFLESETFAGSVCKALERTVVHELRSLKPENNVLSFRLANDKQETHYTNKLELLYADIEKGNYISADENGTVYEYAKKIKPSSAMDFKGNNVLKQVTATDNYLWTSDLKNADLTKPQNLRDGIVCEFQSEKPTEFINLIINGKNTMLADGSISELLKIRGSTLFSWYSEVNKKGAEFNLLNNILRTEGMLHIFVEQDGKWTEKGSLPDVGAETVQQGFLNIKFDKPISGKIKIKIQATTGYWELDEISASFSPLNKIDIYPLTLKQSKFSNNNSCFSLLQDNDNSYYVDTEGEYADFDFENAPMIASKERHYFVRISGFYCKWIYSDSKPNQFAIQSLQNYAPSATIIYLSTVQNLLKK